MSFDLFLKSGTMACGATVGVFVGVSIVFVMGNTIKVLLEALLKWTKPKK